jgi:general stress protein 26
MRILRVGKSAGIMTERELLGFLGKERETMRLAMLDTDGYPLVHPVWFVYDDGRLWITVERTGRKANLLRKSAKVYFTIDKSDPQIGSKGVRGRGVAELIEDNSLALDVIRKQLLKYRGTLDDDYAKDFLGNVVPSQVVVKIRPLWFGAWDYGKPTQEQDVG